MSGCPLAALFGEQGLTREDRDYRGSLYSEIRDAVWANPYQPVWGAEGNDPWPVYKTTFRLIFSGALPFSRRPNALRDAARRTVDSRADLRWGEDGKGYRRMVHPNGICLFGVWEITEKNDYSGFFRPGSRGLVIARFSPNDKAFRGDSRSLSLVGKIFPTMDEEHTDRLDPAHFFTQQDLGNERTRYINDAEMRNSPNISAYRRLPLSALSLARLGRVFGKADKEGDIRQLHEIAELAKPETDPTRTPEFMQLKMAAAQPRIQGRKLDFRDEIYAQIYDRGDPEPQRKLAFDIAVSNRGRTRRFTPAVKRVKVEGWETIGQIVFDRAVASYNGDHVLHFHHPAWRDDRDDPATRFRPPIGDPR